MAHDHERKSEQPGGRKPINADERAGGREADPLHDPGGRRGGLFQRFGARIQERIETTRGGEMEEEELTEPVSVSRPVHAPTPPVAAPTPARPVVEEPAIRRPKEAPKAPRMIVPDGVVIMGSVTSPSDAEISGKIEGDVTVDGVLYLGPSAFITGNVRASSCRIEGVVAGKVECGQDLEIGETGRLNADASAGRRITMAGEVTGNLNTAGILRLLGTAKISGDIRARSFVIEEGAYFNGKCTMRPNAATPTGAAAHEK